MSYVSKDPVNYFSYIGSLTTPPCAEEVVWIDFHEPIDISEDQVSYITYKNYYCFLYLPYFTAGPISSFDGQRWSPEEQFPSHTTA